MIILTPKDKKEIIAWVHKIVGPIAELKRPNYQRYRDLRNKLLHWEFFLCRAKDCIDLLNIIKLCLHEQKNVKKAPTLDDRNN